MAIAPDGQCAVRVQLTDTMTSDRTFTALTAGRYRTLSCTPARRCLYATASPSMQFGFTLSKGHHEPIASSDTLPVLIIGREAKETLHRLFLDEPTVFFGDAKPLLPYIARQKDTILFELNDERPIAFNPFKNSESDADTASYILEAFKTTWDYGTPTPQFDMYMLTACLALLNTDAPALFQLPYLFTSETFRQSVISKLNDPVLKRQWEHYDALLPKEQNDRALSILNRMIPLITDPLIRSVIAQIRTLQLTPESILIVDMPDTERASLLASLVLSRLKGRVYIERPLVHLGASTPVIAVEYLDQLPEALKQKMLTGIIMSFRLGVKDAKELEPYFNLNEGDFKLIELTPGRAHVRMERTHTVETYPHKYRAKPSNETRIRNRSRSQHGTPQKVIDEHLKRFLDGA